MPRTTFSFAPWNDANAVEKLFAEHGSEIAAVITEPVACNSGCLLPAPGYLESLAAMARRHGALLIFDEVITGFRLSLGGAQAFYGVSPDLASFGKAIAGGLPLSVLAGRREILEMMAGGGVAFGGTFNGNPISLAAAATTIQELSRDNGRHSKTPGASANPSCGDSKQRRESMGYLWSRLASAPLLLCTLPSAAR